MSLEDFKEKLAERLKEAKGEGVSSKVISEGLVNLADVALSFDRPQTEEEALVHEMWEVATEDEKKVLANLVLRMVGEGTR